MTCKEFFKSTSFKCILVLVCIALVSGGLLAILNDLWKVSDEEKINRAIQQVFGKDQKVALAKTFDLQDGITLGDGTVLNAYLLDNKSVLLKVEGTKGYHSGSITLYVVASEKDDAYSINQAIVESYASSQTLMSKFNDKSLSSFISNPSYIEAGATYSSMAVRNAINTAQEFIDTKLADYLKEGN